ncbi:hypothetical protein CEUSTIGMA_g2487.t1 [Chlamydomonas eustigma]|uniref:FAD dependent oxidoreductase domain-containing protein n=1 Tax=Chlamydomonas eustigma TaxID=1157962 RepID=A0A250WW20_9CHLO|nr:hypothetical protein CEUSTIGMA_g2487.t1 [Chlamydomonas eustigma]|eukprot:GAX75043.1 hypothetical protein CEUSTIGMA_g2487.t1 [Chlamydomonas eustigma]
MATVGFSRNTSTIERRVVDVVVIGEGALAAGAAYSLSRRGKKVALISSFGVLTKSPSSPKMNHPLLLPGTNSIVTSLCNEAGTYWAGLNSQMTGNQKLLHGRPTLEVSHVGGSDKRAQERVMEQLSLMQEACQEAGVKLGMMKGSNLVAVVPMLRQNPEIGQIMGLIQPGGGILDASVASEFLTTLASRAGVLVRDRLVLAGWKDHGDHFTVRAHAAPTSLQRAASASSSIPLMTPASGALLGRSQADDHVTVSVFEAEQLLLAPDETCWPLESLQLFGVELEGMQMNERHSATCSTSSELNHAPIIRYWGSNSDAQAWSFLLCSGNGEETRSSVKLSVVPKSPTNPGSATAWDWQPEPKATLLGHNLSLAASFVRGLPDSREYVRNGASSLEQQHQVGTTCTANPCLATPDGLPLLGFHPGFEAGRVVVACCASGISAKTTEYVATLASSSSAAAAASREHGLPSAQQSQCTKSASSEEAERLNYAAESWLRHSQEGKSAGQLDPDRETWQAAITSSLLLGSNTNAGQDEETVSKRIFPLGDGFQLSPLLAKAAADLLVEGRTHMDIPAEALSLTRPGLECMNSMQQEGGGSSSETRREGEAVASSAHARMRSVDRWSELDQLQDGSVYRYRNKEDLEREADEREDQRRAKAG